VREIAHDWKSTMRSSWTAYASISLPEGRNEWIPWHFKLRTLPGPRFPLF
jgi:hypothetical protein